jgi:hypothetical protein
MDHTENTASVVKQACLLMRYLALDVLLLRGYVFNESLPSDGYTRHNIEFFCKVYINVVINYLICLELSITS